jgi:hypothetical protein
MRRPYGRAIATTSRPRRMHPRSTSCFPISEMALDLLPDNHPGVDPASVFVQITALREAEPKAA